MLGARGRSGPPTAFGQGSSAPPIPRGLALERRQRKRARPARVRTSMIGCGRGGGGEGEARGAESESEADCRASERTHTSTQLAPHFKTPRPQKAMPAKPPPAPGGADVLATGLKWLVGESWAGGARLPAFSSGGVVSHPQSLDTPPAVVSVDGAIGLAAVRTPVSDAGREKNNDLTSPSPPLPYSLPSRHPRRHVCPQPGHHAHADCRRVRSECERGGGGGIVWVGCQKAVVFCFFQPSPPFFFLPHHTPHRSPPSSSTSSTPPSCCWPAKACAAAASRGGRPPPRARCSRRARSPRPPRSPWPPSSPGSRDAAWPRDPPEPPPWPCRSRLPWSRWRRSRCFAWLRHVAACGHG